MTVYSSFGHEVLTDDECKLKMASFKLW